MNNGFIGAGSGNLMRTNADYSVIGGGAQNLVSAQASYAVIPGGYNNTATGDYSFAAGRLIPPRTRGTR